MNLRRHTPADLQSAPFGRSGIPAGPCGPVLGTGTWYLVLGTWYLVRRSDPAERTGRLADRRRTRTKHDFTRVTLVPTSLGPAQTRRRDGEAITWLLRKRLRRYLMPIAICSRRATRSEIGGCVLNIRPKPRALGLPRRPKAFRGSAMKSWDTAGSTSIGI